MISNSFALPGRMIDDGVRRLKQNLRHLLDMFPPRGIEPLGDGWKLTVRIRLIHARVRSLLMTSEEWDDDAWGTPVSVAHVSLAVWGHAVTGLDVTLPSLFGLVALTGVVVADSLVMVDFINERRKSLPDLHAAVRAAGAERFRPILLTSVTTFAGLTPLMWETGFQARFLVPMVVSLAFGVLFAPFITLLLVPTIYLIPDDAMGMPWTSAGRTVLRGLGMRLGAGRVETGAAE